MAIDLLNKPYEELFTVLMAHEELENYLSPFVDAWKGGAAEQLMGQIASAKIPLSRMISPQLYWVMSGDDFTLDINNPKEPKILCVGNNPDRQNIYGAALGLYNSRIVKLINRKKQLKSCVVIDELPTIYFRGLDNLIATAAFQQGRRVPGVSGFQPAKARLRRQGSRRDPEYRGQYLQRAGRRRNGPDALRAIRKDRAKKTIREHQPQRYLNVDKHPARQSYSWRRKSRRSRKAYSSGL